jgi:hypothetical protein
MNVICECGKKVENYIKDDNLVIKPHECKPTKSFVDIVNDMMPVFGASTNRMMPISPEPYERKA